MAFLPVPTDRDEWLKMRRDYIGGSEAAALLGMPAKFGLSEFSLYMIKRGEQDEPAVDNDRVKDGIWREPAIAAAACQIEGWEMHHAVYAVDDTVRVEMPDGVVKGMGATLDRVIMPTLRDEIEYGCNGPGALECKRVGLKAYRQSWLNGDPPPYYLIQLMHQLACSDYHWGAIAADIVDDRTDEVVDRYRKRFHRHDVLIGNIRERVSEFWDRVRRGSPPDVDGHASTRRALRSMFPRPVEREIDLTGDNRLPGLCVRYAEVLALEKALKTEKDEIANIVREALGEAKRARIAGGIRITRSVGEDTPDRVAKEGEVIRGRKGSDRLTINVPKEEAA